MTAGCQMLPNATLSIVVVVCFDSSKTAKEKAACSRSTKGKKHCWKGHNVYDHCEANYMQLVHPATSCVVRGHWFYGE